MKKYIVILLFLILSNFSYAHARRIGANSIYIQGIGAEKGVYDHGDVISGVKEVRVDTLKKDCFKIIATFSDESQQIYYYCNVFSIKFGKNVKFHPGQYLP